MNQTPKEHVPVTYPTPEQGLHSGQHLISHATGNDPLPTSTLVAHCWVLTGAGLGMAYPADVEMFATADQQLTAAECDALKRFVEHSKSGAVGVGAPDWRALIKMVLEILQRLLAILLVLVVFSAAAVAAPQAPTPPQAPALPEAGPLTYNQAYHKALLEGKPLVVWVGGDFCPRCVNDTKEEFIHFFTDTYAGAVAPAIVVGVPDGRGGLDRVATVTQWIVGDPEFGHMPSVRKAIQAWKAKVSGDARPARATVALGDAPRWSPVAPPAFRPMMRMGGGGARCDG
jgi:hypothetical protein